MGNEKTRRRVLQAGITTLAAAATGTLLTGSQSMACARVVIIGGGVAGGAASIAVKKGNPSAQVTLIERDPTRLAPKSKPTQVTDIASATGYRDLTAADVDLAIDEIVAIDWTSQHAVALSGRTFAFDHLILAPGIAAREEGIAGYNAMAAHEFPHAWTGGRQAYRLQAQIRAMADGGTIIIRAPAGSQRYSQGPYERATQFARYLVREKPRSKIIILDAKDDFPQQEHFLGEWASAFPEGMIEWIPARNGGQITAVDVKAKRLLGSGGWISGDVVNFIPAQMAGKIAQVGGLTNASGWCPVDSNNLCSRLQSSAYILGDANDADRGDKTAHNALRQARLCANARHFSVI
ncbi:MAG: FAD-dependent oxidoreductase [Gammaproteobacteria bacterium]|nr:FAD-dependent oxidoreductase [Gammaproteobacteria bacterium]